MKKLIAIVMALLLMVSLVPAQAEMMAGGWQPCEDSAVTDEVSTAMAKATEELLGSTIEPVAVLGTQVVAGINYCVLCRITPIVPDPVPSYALVYLWVQPDGTASITDIADIDLAPDSFYPDDEDDQFAAAYDAEGNKYPLFEVEKLYVNEAGLLVAIEGHFSRIDINEDEFEYAKQLDGVYYFDVADEYTVSMLNDDLDLEPTDDIVGWYERVYMGGQELEGDCEIALPQSVTTRIATDGEGHVTLIQGEYVPWG